MTTQLERTPATAAYYDDTPTVPFEIPPVVETTDGCAAGQHLNTVVGALVEEAKQSGLPQEDGMFLLGDINSKHLAFSQETITPENSPPIEVSRLVVVAPSDNLHYYYHCAKVSSGDHAAFDFSVHEEHVAGTKSARFVGSTDTDSPTELSSVATEISTKCAENLIDVVVIEKQEGRLTDEALHDIVTPLTSHEAVRRHPMRQFFSKAAMTLSNIIKPHAAA